jgi:hypothetical protein
MMPAKPAPIRLDQPTKGLLDGVSGVHNSKIDRLAVGTLCREHSYRSAHHGFASASALAAPSAAGLDGYRMDGAA